MKVGSGLLALLALGACNGKDGSTEDHGRPTINIVSPEDGATFTQGDEVQLEAEAIYDDGTDAIMTDTTWTAGDWSGQGTSLTTTDLPAGNLTLEVGATVDDKDLSTKIHITVNTAGGEGEGEGEGDTDVVADDTGGVRAIPAGKLTTCACATTSPRASWLPLAVLGLVALRRRR